MARKTTMTELNRLRKAAQENADYFDRPYMVFSDTNGKYRVEKDNASAKHLKEVFYPIQGNPRPRIGTAKSRRASSATDKRPTKRLVLRRLSNVRKGFFPNPVELTNAKTLAAYAQSRANTTGRKYFVSYYEDEPMRALLDVKENRDLLKGIGERVHKVYRPIRRNPSTSTRSEVRSPTRTSTSTRAHTQGNVTVTGGAGDGDTSVTVRRNPRKTKTKIFEVQRGEKHYASATQWIGIAKFFDLAEAKSYARHYAKTHYGAVRVWTP